MRVKPQSPLYVLRQPARKAYDFAPKKDAEKYPYKVKKRGR